MRVWQCGKRGWKIVFWLIGAVLLAGMCGLLLLWFWSPGKVEPFRDRDGSILPGSVSERVTVSIGGARQGMILQGKSDANPVLLFLHGGPGNPEYILAKNYDIGLEEHFTICWWDQRGSGMSYDSSIDPEAMTLDKMIADTLEVTDYLRDRFGVEKIYVMGHSWGSFLGIHAVSLHPEKYLAYIGIGQVVNQMESERLSHAAMMAYALECGDRKLEQKLGEHSLDGPADITIDYLMLRSETLSKMGNGVFHQRQSQWKDLLLPILQAREYTLADKYGYAMGSLKSLDYSMNATQMSCNLMEEIPVVHIPVYFFHGVHDRQVSYQLSREYAQLLQAPVKEFYPFAHSAHSPFMEEPAKFMELVSREILGL